MGNTYAYYRYRIYEVQSAAYLADLQCDLRVDRVVLFLEDDE